MRGDANTIVTLETCFVVTFSFSFAALKMSKRSISISQKKISCWKQRKQNTSRFFKCQWFCGCVFDWAEQLKKVHSLLWEKAANTALLGWWCCCGGWQSFVSLLQKTSKVIKRKWYFKTWPMKTKVKLDT